MKHRLLSSCLPTCLAVLTLCSLALTKAHAAELVLADYGSLGAVVDENKFKAGLKEWIQSCNKLVQQFAALPAEEVDYQFLDLIDSDLPEPVASLYEAVHPKLSYWFETPAEELSSDDRKVMAVLQQYGLEIDAMEGSPFLWVHPNFYTELLAPYLSPVAASFLKIYNKMQPSIYAAFNSHDDLVAWAVQWEDFLTDQVAAQDSGPFTQKASQQYSEAMELLLLEKGYPEWITAYDGEKMNEYSIETLQRTAAQHPGTQTAGIILGLLAVIKLDEYTLSPVNEKICRTKIAAVARPPQKISRQ